MPSQLAAQDEFRALTRRAALQRFVNRFSSRATQRCDVEREHLKAGTFGRRTLTDIGLGRVVGSVVRSRDYTSTFLPRRGSVINRLVAPTAEAYVTQLETTGAGNSAV